MKKLFLALGILIVVCLFAVYIIWYFLCSAPTGMKITEPRFLPNGAAVISMESGMSVSEFATQLEENRVIKSSEIFLTLVQKFRIEKNIKQGVYVFDHKMNVFQVIDRVSSGDFGYTPVKVTIPEGFTTYAIASSAPSKLVDITPEAFMAASEGMEGVLFPDTYFLYPYATSSALIDLMKANFDRKIKPLANDIVQSGHTLEEIIIMASILEKEVQTEEDKGIVADLFWRRLEEGMPLQADSTLTYITGKTSAELTLNDLREDGAYNSYANKGLPPTPISNPGLVSIQAAITPTPNEYVFFLSDNDGATHFSKTYAEHLRLKKKYLP